MKGVDSSPVMYSLPCELIWSLHFKFTVDGWCLNALSLESVSWSGFAIVNVKWFKAVMLDNGGVIMEGVV